VDEQHGSVLVGARDVCGVFIESGFMTDGLAVPFEACFAAIVELGHFNKYRLQREITYNEYQKGGWPDGYLDYAFNYIAKGFRPLHNVGVYANLEDSTSSTTCHRSINNFPPILRCFRSA
jgi:hypothetical protein